MERGGERVFSRWLGRNSALQPLRAHQRSLQTARNIRYSRRKAMFPILDNAQLDRCFSEESRPLRGSRAVAVTPGCAMRRSGVRIPSAPPRSGLTCRPRRRPRGCVGASSEPSHARDVRSSRPGCPVTDRLRAPMTPVEARAPETTSWRHGVLGPLGRRARRSGQPPGAASWGSGPTASAPGLCPTSAGVRASTVRRSLGTGTRRGRRSWQPGAVARRGRAAGSDQDRLVRAPRRRSRQQHRLVTCRVRWHVRVVRRAPTDPVG